MWLEEINNNLFAYWAVVLGLIMVTTVVISSAIFALAVAVKAVELYRLRRVYGKLVKLLGMIANRTREVNPDLSELCQLLIGQMAPGKSREEKQADVDRMLSRLGVSQPDRGVE